MVGLGFGLFLASYGVAVYGWSQLRGCNTGLTAVFWPGSYKGCNADAGSTAPATQGAPTAPTATNPSPSNPITAKPTSGWTKWLAIPSSAPANDTPFGGGNQVQAI